MWRGTLRYFARKRGRWIVPAFWAYHMPLYLLRRMNLVSKERFRGMWATNLTRPARGWTSEQLHGLYDWVANTYNTPLRREDMIERLVEHNAKGHLTVLVSTGFDGLMQRIAKTVGAQMAVGTRVKIQNGVCTGRNIAPLVIGAQKELETRRRLQQQGIEVDFQSSHAYADSITDLSLFEMVGNPHPVYPDIKLAALAERRGWQVYGEVNTEV